MRVYQGRGRRGVVCFGRSSVFVPASLAALCASNVVVVCCLVLFALQLDAAWVDVKRYEATVDAEYAAVQAERAALLQREVGKGFGS